MFFMSCETVLIDEIRELYFLALQLLWYGRENFVSEWKKLSRDT
jgi:hypothetical protein